MSRGSGSPLGRVLGKGAAHGGVHHWWTQRVSAVALVPLTIWFLVSLVGLPDFSHASVAGFLAGTWHAIAMLLLVVCLCWHSNLGVRVVIEDYFHQNSTKVAALVLSGFLHAVLLAAGLLAILRVAVSGPV